MAGFVPDVALRLILVHPLLLEAVELRVEGHLLIIIGGGAKEREEKKNNYLVLRIVMLVQSQKCS